VFLSRAAGGRVCRHHGSAVVPRLVAADALDIGLDPVRQELDRAGGPRVATGGPSAWCVASGGVQRGVVEHE
jgi:hypothetical protein